MKQRNFLVNKWYDSILSDFNRSSPSQDCRIFEANGSVNIPMGPRSHVGEVRLLISPSSQGFSMTVNPNASNDSEAQVYAENAVFGFLDVFLTQTYGVVRRPVAVEVAGLSVDPVNSSPVAFRLAGRKAGWQYLDLLRDVK